MAVIMPSDGQVSPVLWAEAVEMYLSAGMDSQNTRRAYRRHLLDAGAFFGNPPLASVLGMDLSEFRSAILSQELAPASVAQCFSAVRSFLAWSRMLGLHQLGSDVVAIALKTPRATVQSRYAVLTEREILSILKAAASLRDQTILVLLLGSGLRVAEASGLDTSDLIEEQDGGLLIHVREGKGRKDRIVPVREDVEQMLRSYLQSTERFLGEAGPLFLSQDAGAASRKTRRLSTRAIAMIVTDTARRAGIQAKRVSPHALRHTYAVRCLRAGGNVVAVSKLLGHSSIATTQRYVDHLAVSELRDAIPALPAIEQSRELAS